MNIKNKRITVLGLGKSGYGAAKLANHLGARVFVSDQGNEKTTLSNANKLLVKYNIAFETGLHSENIYDSSLIIVSPGISKDSKVVKDAVKLKIPVISEIEFAFHYTKSPIIAITGSNGKTTTSKILFDMLKNTNVKPVLGGNIGISFSEQVLFEKIKPKKNQIYILEISSFQLEKIKNFKPDIAIFLNISNDHLDRHITMDEYIKMKFRLIENMIEKDIIIYNGDDEILVKGFKNITLDKIKFSIESQTKHYSLRNGCVFNDKNKKILSENNFSIPGKHNISNFFAAATCAKILNVSEKSIIKAFKSFAGVQHRLEYVKNINNIKFINDSKATNIDSVITAINTIKEPIILLLGGRNKNSNFRLLLPHIKASLIKLVISYGESGGHIKTVLGDAVRSYSTIDLNSAVKKAHNLAAAGDTILLSPGCASFDQFSNFEERGDHFKNYVNNHI